MDRVRRRRRRVGSFGAAKGACGSHLPHASAYVRRVLLSALYTLADWPTRRGDALQDDGGQGGGRGAYRSSADAARGAATCGAAVEQLGRVASADEAHIAWASIATSDVSLHDVRHGTPACSSPVPAPPIHHPPSSSRRSPDASSTCKDAHGRGKRSRGGATRRHAPQCHHRVRQPTPPQCGCGSRVRRGKGGSAQPRLCLRSPGHALHLRPR
jgi:hypothetical protein